MNNLDTSSIKVMVKSPCKFKRCWYKNLENDKKYTIKLLVEK